MAQEDRGGCEGALLSQDFRFFVELPEGIMTLTLQPGAITLETLERIYRGA